MVIWAVALLRMIYMTVAIRSLLRLFSCRARQSVANQPTTGWGGPEGGNVEAELAGLSSRQGGSRAPLQRLPTAQASAVKNEADELLQVCGVLR
jgi:hypothetical protein